MTPVFWMWVWLLAVLRAGVAALGRLGRRLAAARRARRRRAVIPVGEAHLTEFTGLSRSDLDRAFRGPAGRPRPRIRSL